MRIVEVFLAFLKLGLTSFGGPVAHLGYFRDEFVVRRRWLGDEAYGEILALSQFLPGPASSQTGFMLGWMRAGPVGALAAWIAFTAPSVGLLVIFAAVVRMSAQGVLDGALHGLKLVAVVIVAQALWGMAGTLAPDTRRRLIAIGAALIVLIASSSLSHLAVILLGGVAGCLICRDIPTSGRSGEGDGLQALRISPLAGGITLLAFLLLLLAVPLLELAGNGGYLALFDVFYRTGALVFGGGHVVLPLLEAELVPAGWVTSDRFLAGYGVAQALPGPLFSFAAYLGLVADVPQNRLLLSLICLLAIFLPGFLLVVGFVPFWAQLRQRRLVQAALCGVNAAVVGILAAALYDPVALGAIKEPGDLLLVAAGLALLIGFRLPPWLVVLGLALAGFAVDRI